MGRAVDPLQRALAAYDDEDFEAALAATREVPTDAPAYPEALEVRASALLELGDADAAAGAYDELVALFPEDVPTLLGAATAHLERDDVAAAAPRALELAERARGLARSDPELTAEAELVRAQAFALDGDPAAALQAAQNVLLYDDEHLDALLERAYALFELGRFDDARAAFASLVEKEPEEPGAHHGLGLVAERRGEDAAVHFEAAHRLAPHDYPRVHHLAPEAFDAAVAEALAQLPDHARPHLENVIVHAEPWPSDEDVREGLSPSILGVFEGTSVDERRLTGLSDPFGADHRTARIRLFQNNLERFAVTREALVEQIRITVLHEVGHLLGLSEDDLFDRGLD